METPEELNLKVIKEPPFIRAMYKVISGEKAGFATEEDRKLTEEEKAAMLEELKKGSFSESNAANRFPRYRLLINCYSDQRLKNPTKDDEWITAELKRLDPFMLKREVERRGAGGKTFVIMEVYGAKD